MEQDDASEPSQQNKRRNKMGLGLKDILKKKDEMDERNSRPDIEWFSLKKKNPVRVRFLQELDEDSRNYDSTKGKVLFLTEHTSPYDFTRRAECSFESEGRCWACEMTHVEREFVDDQGNKKFNPWGQKTNMYVQVVTEDGDVQVLSRPAPGNFFDKVYEEATDNDGSISEQTFRISKGSARNASWELKALTKEQIEVPETVELVDLESAVGRKIPYADQKRFYLPNETVVNDTPSVSEVKEDATKIGENW